MIKLDEHIGETIFVCPKHPLNPQDSGQKVYGVKLVLGDHLKTGHA
jgi:hypothetical protein